jgi:hypothetical protein
MWPGPPAHAWRPGDDLASLGLPRFVVKDLDHPERPATRYEMVFLFVETFHLKEVVAQQEEAAAASARALPGAGSPYDPRTVLKPEPFADVPEQHWAAEAVEAWRRYERRWMEGYPDRTFKGKRPVRRREFAGYLHNLVGRLHSEHPTIPWRPVERAPEPFADVAPGDWPWVPVEELRRWGILHGHADGTFRGKELLTRGELQACLERATRLFGDQ